MAEYLFFFLCTRTKKDNCFQRMPVVVGKHLLNRQITVNKMDFRKQIVVVNSQLIQYCPSSVATYCLSIVVLFYACFYTTFIMVVSECLPVVHAAM